MKDASLSYLLWHLGSVGVIVATPAFLLLLAAVPLLVRSARTPAERLAAVLRSAALTFLTLGLAGLALTVSLPATRMTVIAAVDLSESIDADGRAWSLRRLNAVAGALAPGDELGIVTFAGGARVARPPGPPAPITSLPQPPMRNATDVGQGLDTALALLPPDSSHRLLLISDGNETRGRARAKLAAALRARASVFTAAPPHAGIADVSVDKLVVPPLVAEGSIFPIRIVARNSHGERAATLTLGLDGQAVGSQSVTLQQGLNVMEIPYRLDETGSHRLRAQVTAEGDGLPGNDYRDATVMVAGPPRVLLLSSSRQSPLATALESKEVAVDVEAASDVPKDAQALLAYHCIVAEDVVAKDLSGSQLGALERYVRDFGGGLIFAGGTQSFGDPGFRGTPLERMLPVTLEPRRSPPRERDPLALMILIDRSNSMGYAARPAPGSSLPQRDPNTSKLHYAKAAALAVIRQLKDRDRVGVIAFDSQALPIAPLKPLSQNRARLEALIPRLQENGGTDFYDALDWASTQLSESHVARRHIILLTDGDTNRSAADHYPLIASLAQAGISVTTIRIGDDVVNLSLLNDISERTGGKFYHVENVETLPQLMLRDTSAAMAQASAPGEDFYPLAARGTQILSGIKADLPPLHGYAFARAKRRADVLVYVPGRADREPILAAWQYGLGRVAAFTADPSNDAEAWPGWDSYTKFWSQIVRWAMREQTPWDYAITAHRRNGKITLMVTDFDPRRGGVLFARLHLSETSTEDLTLAPIAPRQFEVDLPAVPGGRYPITVLRRLGRSDVSENTQVVSIPAKDEEPQEEFLTTQPNTLLLQQIAAQTGGMFAPTVRDLLARRSGTQRLRFRLDFILIPLAMICFLGDVAVRRLWGVWGSGIRG